MRCDAVVRGGAKDGGGVGVVLGMDGAMGDARDVEARENYSLTAVVLRVAGEGVPRLVPCREVWI